MRKLIALTLALTTGIGFYSGSAQDDRKPKEGVQHQTTDQEKARQDKMTHDNMNGDNRSAVDARPRTNTPDISSWPEASQMAAKEMMSKYGNPDGVMDDELVWRNKGPWKKICVSKMESKHDFPMSHTDMMTQTISFRVPADKFDDLGNYDGSVTFDRTQGLLSARCDKEENNILALNLAYDIIKGKKSVEEARAAFGKIVMEKKKGGNPEYMQKLMFSPDMNAADPDKPLSDKMGMVK